MSKDKIESIVYATLIVFIVLGLVAYRADLKSKTETTEPVPTPISDVSSSPETPSERVILYDVPLDANTQLEIKEICSEFNIDYELILGIIATESRFKPDVIGDGGNSFGLMQIQPKWCQNLIERESITDILDPLQNVRLGCAIFSQLKDLYDTDYRALQAYNTGNPNSQNGYAEKVYKNKDDLKTRLFEMSLDGAEKI